MMREILFRGKLKEIVLGKPAPAVWLEGGIFCDPILQRTFILVDDKHAYIPGMGNMGGFKVHEVFPETVGQYTCLKDRNGVRIFEGDIIKTHYANTPKADFIEQVVFHNGRFCGMYERDKMKMWATLPDGIKRLSQDKTDYMEWCEVIGNIYDNPELISAPREEECDG